MSDVKPTADIEGKRATEPGQLATVRAVPITASTPHPIGASANDSSPNGMSRKLTTAQGMTQRAVTGTAIRFAASPYSAKRLKC